MNGQRTVYAIFPIITYYCCAKYVIFRVGSYKSSSRAITDLLTKPQLETYYDLYKFDIELYEYAINLFRHRFSLTGCS